MSQTTDYNIWQQELGEAGFQSNASELHGIVTGYLCTGAGLSLERLSDLLQQPMTPPAQTSILRMVRDAQVGLVDEYLGFEPLLPGEDIALSERVRGLSAWCGDAGGRTSETRQPIETFSHPRSLHRFR